MKICFHTYSSDYRAELSQVYVTSEESKSKNKSYQTSVQGRKQTSGAPNDCVLSFNPISLN